MADALDRVAPLLRGLGGQFAEPVLKGLLCEWLGKAPIKEIVKRVEKNEVLWNLIPEQTQNRVRGVMRGVKTEFFTAEWAVNAVRKNHPAHASLFLGWPKGMKWLEEQIEILRKEVYLPNQSV